MVHALEAGDPRHAGKYRLLGRLGRGGMGQVFLGQSPGGRLVAVKLIRGELAGDPDFRARFAREIATARTISGIFTVPVVDADVDGPQPWLVTAFVDGPSLADAVASQGPVPSGPALTLAAGLAEGLEVIHAAGVVHRDLKPSNVLLASDGPRIIDFGISHTAEASGLTRTGWVAGSPGFMSPEQAEGIPAGPASDIFSLGSVLMFAVTGYEPFGSGTAAALLYRVVHSRPDTSQVPASIRPLVERCLEKDPRHRPTAGEIVAEIGSAHLAEGWLPGAAGDQAGYPAALTAPGSEAAEARPSPPVFPSTLTTARQQGTSSAVTWPVQPPGTTASRPGPLKRRGPLRRRGRGPLWGAAVTVVAVLGAAALTVSLHRSAAVQPTPSNSPSRLAASTASASQAIPASRRSAAPPAPSVSEPGNPSPGYNQYTNPRYGFTALWPDTFSAQPPPGDGDGQAWAGPGGQVLLSAYGANNILGYSPEQDEAADASRLSAVYMNIRGNVVTVSGYKDGGRTIVYERDVVGPGAIDTIYWSYPANQKAQWDAAVTLTALTFRPGDLSTAH
jgi:serine/threonine protein kinase